MWGNKRSKGWTSCLISGEFIDRLEILENTYGTFNEVFSAFFYKVKQRLKVAFLEVCCSISAQSRICIIKIKIRNKLGITNKKNEEFYCEFTL